MALQELRQRGCRFARAGGGRAFDPLRDVIPSFSTTGDDPQRVLNDLQQPHDGRIVVLPIHGTPDVAHPPVTTPPALLARYLRYLHDHHYHVIAMRGPQNVAHAENGQWLYLFRPRHGVLQAEKLVNMARQNYHLEPNVNFTPDGKWIVFRSNMFGPAQILAVEIAKAS